MIRQNKLSVSIKKLWAEGYTKTEIADILKCDRKTVYNHTVELGRCSKKPKSSAKYKNKISNEKGKFRENIKVSTEYISNYLDSHHCVDCGNSDKRVLDFDHVRGKKEFGISKAKVCGFNLELIKEEIKKCEVRCSNCHRIVTFERRNKN
jgi:hypothetical protein